MAITTDVTDGCQSQQTATTQLPEVVIGVLVGVTDSGSPLVVFADSGEAQGVVAKTLVAVSIDDVGGEVALLFENGDRKYPMIIGRVKTSESNRPINHTVSKLNVDISEDKLTLTAEKEIELKCGKASIILTKAGKVLIRGTYVLSRSTGANRIKGGSIQLN